MTIDEAIERSNRIAEKNEELYKTTHPAFRLFDYKKCAKDSRQLVEWLKELQRYREAWEKVKADIDKEIKDLNEPFVADGVDYEIVELEWVLEVIDKHLKEVNE